MHDLYEKEKTLLQCAPSKNINIKERPQKNQAFTNVDASSYLIY